MKSFKIFFNRGKHKVQTDVQGIDLNDAIEKLKKRSLNENIVINKVKDNSTNQIVLDNQKRKKSGKVTT